MIGKLAFIVIVSPLLSLCDGGSTPPPDCHVIRGDSQTITYCHELNGRSQRAKHYCANPWTGYRNWQYGTTRVHDGQLSSVLAACHVPVTQQHAEVR